MNNIKNILVLLIILIFNIPSIAQIESINQGNYRSFLIKKIKAAKSAEDTSLLAQAIRQIEPFAKKDSLLALAYHELGVLNYDNYDALGSLNNAKKALNIRESIYTIPHIDIARSYRNIGASYMDIKQLEKAREATQKAIDIAEKLEENAKVLNVLSESYKNFGNVLIKQGDYSNSEIHLQLAMTTEELRGAPPLNKNLQELFVNLYIELKEPKDIIQRSKDIIRKLEKSKDTNWINYVNAYNNLGIGYDLIDSIQKSFIAYHESQIYQKRTYPEYTTLKNLSILNRKIGKPYKALALAREAIEVVETDPYFDDFDLAECLNTEAMALVALDSLESALFVIRKALEPFDSTEVISEKQLYLVIQRDHLQILKALAATKKEEKYLTQSVPVMQGLISTIDKLRQNYLSEDSKIFLLENAKPILGECIYMCWELCSNTKDNQYALRALEYSERSKSLILLEALLQAKALKEKAVEHSFFQEEAKIFRQITDAELERQELVLNKDTTETIDLIDEKLRDLNYKLVNQKEKLRKKNPQLFTTLSKAYDTLDLPRIKENLQSSLIEYFVSEKFIYGFGIQKEQKEILFIQIDRDSISLMVNQLRESIEISALSESENEIKKNELKFINAALYLYTKLIKPFEEKMEFDSNLTIIPDEILGYIPFEALIKKRPTKIGAWKTYDYLVKEPFPIQYNYSIALSEEMKTKNLNPTNKMFIGFAPSFENRTADSLESLDNNISEVQSIQKILGGDVFLAEEATRENFQSFASQYSVIHLATHSKANDLAGDFSFVAFSQTTNNDGLLYNLELYPLQLNAELVVLSACETGKGELKKGEGIISVARGFSYAGAKSIVNTLWSVRDTYIQDIMDVFYQHLQNGEKKDIALHKAKNEFILKGKSNPFYWAGFILIGDEEKIISVKSVNICYIPLVLLLGLLLIFFFKNRTK